MYVDFVFSDIYSIFRASRTARVGQVFTRPILKVKFSLVSKELYVAWFIVIISDAMCES